MNLQEAIKSGKPFRRPTWTHADWIVVHKFPKENPYMGGELRHLKADEFTTLSYLDDLLAEDWIVEGEVKSDQ